MPMEEKSVTNVEENRIIASNLCYCYPEAQKNAVDDVSMRVKKGDSRPQWQRQIDAGQAL